MGFLSASSTITRLHAAVPGGMNRDAVTRAVNQNTFRAHDDDGLPKPEAYGWVGIHDPLALELDDTDLFFQGFLVLGFRFDKRAAPAKLIRLERQRAEEERRREAGLDRLGRAMRTEIKEEVEARLLQQALPSPSLFEMAWNLDKQCVYFTGKSKGPREAFISLFRQTFGVTPVPMIPFLTAEYVGLAPVKVDAVRSVDPTPLNVVERAAAAAAGGAGS